MRPIASTWVASMQNIAAPDRLRLLMWVKCQSVGTPSSAEYWHIGDTTTRFFKVRPRSLIGENRALMRGSSGRNGGKAGRDASEPLPSPQAAGRATLPYGLMPAALI